MQLRPWEGLVVMKCSLKIVPLLQNSKAWLEVEWDQVQWKGRKVTWFRVVSHGEKQSVLWNRKDWDWQRVIPEIITKCLTQGLGFWTGYKLIHLSTWLHFMFTLTLVLCRRCIVARFGFVKGTSHPFLKTKPSKTKQNKKATYKGVVHKNTVSQQ